MTAPQLSVAQAPPPGLGPVRPRSAATPLYDALVHEYRLALRCVPGDHGMDDRLAGVASSFSPEFGHLPYSRRAAGTVPRQVSRHRGASGDNPGSAQY